VPSAAPGAHGSVGGTAAGRAEVSCPNSHPGAPSTAACGGSVGGLVGRLVTGASLIVGRAGIVRWVSVAALDVDPDGTVVGTGFAGASEVSDGTGSAGIVVTTDGPGPGRRGTSTTPNACAPPTAATAIDAPMRIFAGTMASTAAARFATGQDRRCDVLRGPAPAEITDGCASMMNSLNAPEIGTLGPLFAHCRQHGIEPERRTLDTADDSSSQPAMAFPAPGNSSPSVRSCLFVAVNSKGYVTRRTVSAPTAVNLRPVGDFPRADRPSKESPSTDPQNGAHHGLHSIDRVHHRAAERTA
jgi:hypothetical protein